ncbi:DUF4115 domain-containing protein [Virgibacillus sp. MSJ-26]|uniref:helix-turn-helix domain-containing protein n=1 Tax=Virgibacillus sp. MSJ-26 TaxID=2841522 RepID=UPI001C110E8D|nr:helix-turn-helix domain-containing protein [Virgibacillus sp. MSJ-26]MBU5466709.1 DUF4115 domain-containing protein [Virgibacillus sp. MSJ-26]
MGIGARLKEAREEKGISLESLQETTKIQKRYLQAIEEENFNILPGRFYARAFIKEYALAVNINVDELFEEYEDDLPKPEEQTSTQYTRMQRTRKETNLSKNSALFSIIPTVIVVLLIIGVIFAVWFFMFEGSSSNEEIKTDEEQGDNTFTRSDNDQNNDNADTEDEDVDEEDETEENDSDLGIEIVDEDSEGQSGTVFELSNTSDDTNLILESRGETWLEIVNDQDEQLYYGILSEADSPEEIDISDEKELYFSIGNASVLDIKFNDLDFEYPSNPNDNVVQKFWVNIK